VGVLYMLSLTYLTFQSPAGARAFLQAVSPSLGAQLQERAYGADCRPVYANIRRVDDARCSRCRVLLTRCWLGGGRRTMVLDEFVLAHTLGWWAKALMLRHSGMCVGSCAARAPLGQPLR
jgi:phosphatidylserine synthase 2